MPQHAIQQVSALLAAYSPHFAGSDYTHVIRWLGEGCDLERDILPAIRDWTARKQDIRYVGFFQPYVMARRDKRLKAAMPPDPEAIHRKARNIAFLIRKLKRCHPDKARWLADYEARNGAIEV